MTLTLCTDRTAADWLTDSPLPWQRLVAFGPAGFAASARLRLLPDPAYPEQSENDVEAEEWRSGQLPVLFEVLAAGTTTPDDCSFCFWEGSGISWAGKPTGDGPKVVLPERAYWLFRGPATTPVAEEPAFVWPADRAWCFAFDVDPHWAGISGPIDLIDRLVADPRLDVVRADPDEPQPHYR
ncbi:hypothetical protein [Actinoplanes sp. NPDC051859]|uniref:hypothetical protein n=1 Tax=Actinoplanes sp. NPDC051859 TaxID=3363909 RepID=UPI00379C0F0B